MPNPVLPAHAGKLRRNSGAFPCRVLRLACLAAGAALLFVLLAPAAASAHAYLASSQPAAGERLGTTPSEVTLNFTELLTSSSTATVTSPAGKVFSGTTSAEQIVIPISTNEAGTYQVQWTSVSAIDGHVLRGSFTFGVGVALTKAKAGVPSGLARYGVTLTVERAVEDTALLLAIGMIVLEGAARSDPDLSWVSPQVGLALLVAAVGAAAVVTTEALSAASSASLSALGTYLSNGFPGVARIARFAFEATGSALAWAGGPARPRLRVALPVVVLGAAVGLAASGHAASLRPEWWGITLDAAHIAAAGIWAGGILALVTLRPPGGWRGPGGRRLLAAFSPVALAAFAATVVLGAIQAIGEIGSVHALFHTDYGRTLLVKVALVAAMIPLSLLAWKAARRLFRLEAALAVGVIAAAALLGAYPSPAVDLATPPPAPASTVGALPQPGELTLGSHAGNVLVGLSLKPGAPGPNQAFVYLLPLDGPATAAKVGVTMTVGSQAVPLNGCGATCRRGTVTVGGGDTVDVGVAGPGGGTATFTLPGLPAPSGAALLAKMQQSMHALSAWEDHETLSTGSGPVGTTDYLFQAPDRIQENSNGGAEVVLIGGTRYLTNGTGQPWQVESGGPPP
ncbi:MAG TPA: copper resistance protein CopC, partial [Actinomycetota bacterium]|nr:copper resistance protein CopC [Actinomycetota bacterium]